MTPTATILLLGLQLLDVSSCRFPHKLLAALARSLPSSLDTLVLAMPISWKGILQQYAGRLHRSHVDKTEVRVIDFVDEGNVALMRMWDKRQAGYKAMGYRMTSSVTTMDLL